MAPILYIINGSPPARTAWMAARAIPGLNVEIKHVNLAAREQFEDWFLKMNPDHCVPTLDDDGFYLYESRAILRYLTNEYDTEGSLYPRDNKARAMVDKMLDRDLGYYYKHIGQYVYLRVFIAKPKEELSDSDVHSVLNNLETVTPLKEDKFIAGDSLTIADFAIYQTVAFLEMLDFSLEAYPHVAAWKDKIKALPCAADVTESFDIFKAFARTEQFDVMMQRRRAAHTAN